MINAPVWVWTALSPEGERGVIFYNSQIDETTEIPVMFIGVSYEDAMLFEEFAKDVAEENGVKPELVKMRLIQMDEEEPSNAFTN